MRVLLGFLLITLLACEPLPPSYGPAQMAADTGSGTRIFHIYREITQEGLKGAQVLNNIESPTAVLEEGDSYILSKKVYVVQVRTSLNFSGVFAHLYVWKYDEELTKIFGELGLL